MVYKIIDIQGVGDVYAQKLIAAGINTIDDLLEKGKSAKGRKELEDATYGGKNEMRQFQREGIRV